MIGEILIWYGALAAPFKVLVWLLATGLILSIVKRLVKLAILVTILLILIFVLRAVTMNI